MNKMRVVLALVTVLTVSMVITYTVASNYVKAENEQVIRVMEQKNRSLRKEFDRVNAQIGKLDHLISEIQKVDDQIREDNDLPLINDDIRKLGIGGTDTEYYLEENLGESDQTRLQKILTKLDELERQYQFELKSYKTIVNVVARKRDSLQYLPSIMPIPEEAYRVSRNFSRRMFHPILKRTRPHKGIDIACAEGTPIYAAADGIIRYAGLNSGYGKYVKIAHKNDAVDFGYSTSYAHMSKIHVKRGQRVKRGDIIGEVGSTGLSTAPHLHYEVRYKGKPIKPDEYYYVNLK